jgi:hypothetical protein
MKVESLSFGSVIHSAIEIWYRSVEDANRLWIVLDFIDRSFPERATDENQQANWHLARAIMTGYASRYATEDFTIIEIEKSFTGNIRNPDTGRCSQTFVMAGKADAIVQRSDGMYLLEHKTAASIDSNYLDKLWTDTQIALYCYYLRELGYPIVGVIYNVLLKSRLKQSKGETQEEYEARHAELAAKNKSGKSTAKRQMPETNEEFQGRLAAWYAKALAASTMLDPNSTRHRNLTTVSADSLAIWCSVPRCAPCATPSRTLSAAFSFCVAQRRLLTLLFCLLPS